MDRHHIGMGAVASSSTTQEDDLLISFSGNDDDAPVVILPVALNDDHAVVDGNKNHNNAASSHVKRTPPEMSLARKVTKIWRESQGQAPKAVEALFYIEHQGLRLLSFKGLPAWAVPCPKDFNYMRHIGGDKQHYQITKRLQVKIDIDPSSERAWVKPLLDYAMIEWLANDFRRLDAVKKLWEAYDFLCFWSVEAAKRGRALPLHKAINVYYEKSILNYRIHVHEMMSSYEEEGEEGPNATLVDVKDDGADDGADEDAANKGLVAEGKGKGKGKMKEITSNSIAEKAEWKKAHDDGGADVRSVDPIPTNNASQSIPDVSTSHTPLRNAASKRPRFDMPWVPPSRIANRNVPPPASSRAPQTANKHQLGTPIAASTPRAAVDLASLSTWRPEKPANATDPDPDPPRFASPQDAVKWINNKATEAVVNYQDDGPDSAPPAYISFKSWSSFFEQQLLTHDTEPRFDNPWFSTEQSLQQFIRALHETFHEDKEGNEFSSELREWVLAVSRKLEDRKREREHCDRVASILGRTMAGIAKDKLSRNGK
ncbi:hypothetical protein M434DRAFT_378155 [Hypoxylon sp. CO27-5]|nr:hypothetical protein M434DRAFT_378155 [Hypoxylon sp. CO27-5]